MLASIVLATDGHQQAAVAVSDGAGPVEDLQFTLGEGPGVDAHAEGRAVLVGDLAGRVTRWAHFVPAAWALGVRAAFVPAADGRGSTPACCPCTPITSTPSVPTSSGNWRSSPDGSPTPCWPCSPVPGRRSWPGRWPTGRPPGGGAPGDRHGRHAGRVLRPGRAGAVAGHGVHRRDDRRRGGAADRGAEAAVRTMTTVNDTCRPEVVGSVRRGGDGEDVRCRIVRSGWPTPWSGWPTP